MRKDETVTLLPPSFCANHGGPSCRVVHCPGGHLHGLPWQPLGWVIYTQQTGIAHCFGIRGSRQSQGANRLSTGERVFLLNVTGAGTTPSSHFVKNPAEHMCPHPGTSDNKSGFKPGTSQTSATVCTRLLEAEILQPPGPS